MSVIAHCACGQLAGLRAEIERLKTANADGLRDGLEARADAVTAERQLKGAVDLLRELAQMPLCATGKDFDRLVKAARDLLPEYGGGGR